MTGTGAAGWYRALHIRIASMNCAQAPMAQPPRNVDLWMRCSQRRPVACSYGLTHDRTCGQHVYRPRRRCLQQPSVASTLCRVRMPRTELRPSYGAQRGRVVWRRRSIIHAATRYPRYHARSVRTPCTPTHLILQQRGRTREQVVDSSLTLRNELRPHSTLAVHGAHLRGASNGLNGLPAHSEHNASDDMHTAVAAASPVPYARWHGARYNARSSRPRSLVVHAASGERSSSELMARPRPPRELPSVLSADDDGPDPTTSTKPMRQTVRGPAKP